jgi:hypothetical protein
MTGWVVERKRTAPATVAPVGARTLMPPHSQEAERRTGRHAGRTGSRWGLRALVIGGLAGAAWLLTGSAAQAADHDATPGGLLGPSLIGAVVDGDTASPAAGTILDAVARPLRSDRPSGNDRHVTSSSLRTAPVKVLDRPVAVLTETLDEVTRPSGSTDADHTRGAVDRVVREITGPLRLTGGPADSAQLAPVAAPITRTLRPVTDLLHHAAPAITAQRPTPASAPVGDLTADPRPKPAVTPADDVAAEPRPEPARPPADDVVATEADTAAGDRTVGAAGTTGERHSIVTDRHPATVTAAAPGTVRDTTPGGDGPAPLQVHLGALSGISTSGPGAPTEGGSPAYLPAAVAGNTVAHRLPNATDVGVRRHDAEAPTVSPD